MAGRAADVIAALKLSGSYRYATCIPIDPISCQLQTNEISIAEIQARQTAHLSQFAATAARLQKLAQKELNRDCFTTEDQAFVSGLMQAADTFELGCTRAPAFSGWHPQLFYRAFYWDDQTFHTAFGCGAADMLIADVHTDLPSLVDTDPGSVLHEAVGRVNLLMIAVDNGADHFVCAGPVSSHYELETIGPPFRLTDDDWKNVLWSPYSIEGLKPPVWTESYLVPGR
jgi:hypothetical protein